MEVDFSREIRYVMYVKFFRGDSSMTGPLPVNSRQAIENRIAEGRIPSYGPFIMVAARPVFILIAQAIALLLLKLFDVQNAAVEIRNWWSVYGTLADLGCLGLLCWLTRREGIRIWDLIGFEKKRLKADVAIGLGIILLVFPIVVFGFGQLAMLLIYGSTSPAFPEGTFIRTLPLMAVLYSRLIWWPVWSATEELTYEGYSLPRMQVITKSTPLTVLIISFFYSIQHSFLALADFRYGLYMFVLFVPLTISLQLIYLRVRRLTPLILGHWLMDLFSALFMLQVA